MGADYYNADTENGDHMDDPSEDGLFMLLSDLNRAGNTFISIAPAGNDLAWSVTVTLLPDGTYEVGRADPSRDEQHCDNATSPNDIARDLTIWLAARDLRLPSQKTNHSLVPGTACSHTQPLAATAWPRTGSSARPSSGERRDGTLMATPPRPSADIPGKPMPFQKIFWHLIIRVLT
jgi:hypothetical protein